MSILVSIENLLSGNFVEDTRMEFKEGWNPISVMRSVCAFANDFENEGSGYIIIGVAEKNGKALRPVKGFNPDKFDKIQMELVGYCNLIQPSYVPRLSLEEIDNKQILVIWVPAGSNRPYKVPDDVLSKRKTYNYRIRQFSSSVVPNAEQETELIQLTAKIPFDDRVNTHANVNELNFGLMREHLAKTGSKLFRESASMNKEELAEKMNLCQGAIRNRRYRNRRIGEFLKELSLTEGRGTGIPTMKRVLSENGSDAPKFDTNEPERSFFVTELLIHPDFPTDENEGGQIGGQIGDLTDRQKEILRLINANNEISRAGIAEVIHISESAIQKHLNTLKKKGSLERVGGTRGHWEVINKTLLK